MMGKRCRLFTLVGAAVFTTVLAVTGPAMSPTPDESPEPVLAAPYDWF